MTDSHWYNGSGYAAGCRCDLCRSATRARTARRRTERADLRALQDGRLVAPVPAERHGKPTTYNDWSCRCEPCTDASAQKAAVRRATS